MYKVINFFTDLQDNEHAYNVGDVFPRDGMNVTPDRLLELSGSDNLQGKPLIELVEGENPVKVDKKAELEAKSPKKGSKKPKSE